MLNIFTPSASTSPSGCFYTTQALRDLCAIWDEHGSSVLNVHGSTGDMIFLGTTTDQLEPCFAKLTAKGWDLGGSGSAMRTPAAAWAWPVRVLLLRHHGPDLPAHPGIPVRYAPAVFPYKFKIKNSGCPNDCVAAVARADLSVIGVWKTTFASTRRPCGLSGGEIKPRGAVPLCQTGCEG